MNDLKYFVYLRIFLNIVIHLLFIFLIHTNLLVVTQHFDILWALAKKGKCFKGNWLPEVQIPCI